MSAAEQILEKKKELLKSDDFILIFTDIRDFKRFKLRFKNYDIMKNRNIIVDKKNLLKFSSFYPEILVIKNGYITKRIYQRPDNNYGFNEFFEILSNK